MVPWVPWFPHLDVSRLDAKSSMILFEFLKSALRELPGKSPQWAPESAGFQPVSGGGLKRSPL